MDLKQFHGEIRTDFGKEAATRVRNAGRLPAVVYGSDLEESISITLDPRDMLPMVIRENEGRQFELVLGDKTHKVFIKEFQIHPVRKNLIHVDLQATTPTRPIRAKVPVRLQGPAEGEKLGGRVFKVAYDILVEALPEQFPSVVEVDIRPMITGEVVYVDDLPWADGVKPIFRERYPVVLVKMPRGADEEKEDEAEEAEGEEGDDAEGAETEAKPEATE